MVFLAKAKFKRRSRRLPVILLALASSCSTGSIAMAQEDVPGVFPANRSYSP